MGQHISHCKLGNEPSIGSFEPHVGERRKWRLPGAAPKTLLLLNNDDSTAPSRATTSTGQSYSNTSFSPPSLHWSSSISTGNGNGNGNSSIHANSNHHTNPMHHPHALRYTTSTRNLQNPTTEGATTTMTTKTTIPSTHQLRSRVESDPTLLPTLEQQQQHTQYQHGRKDQSFSQQGGAPADKRSNPVKLPRKRHTLGCPKNPERSNDVSAHSNSSSHSHETPQGASYLERMYDSRTWEMYQRITTYREKVDAFNATNTSAERNENDDVRNSASHTYMSDPVQRVTNSSTMVGGVDYDNFYDPGVDDDHDSRGGGFFLEDHSAPPYRHHRQCDNGRHHHHHNNAETYSEWEHMYGDDVETNGEPGNDSTNMQGGQHETIFLFDF